MSRVKEERCLVGLNRISVCWRDLFSLAVALVFLLLIACPLAHAQDIKFKRVLLTEEFLDGPRLVRAFVETNTDNENVLCTFAENDPGFGALRLAGLVIMCRPRVIEDEVGVKVGVGIIIVLPVLFETRKGFVFELTLFQSEAEYYNDPVPCPGAC